MTLQEIINKFHTYTDDQSELSSQEEIDLANDVYQDIYSDRDWEWLKKEASGTLDSFTNSDSHINVPSDFMRFSVNNNMTDNTYEPDNNAVPKVVYIITADGSYDPWQVVNFSDRRKYLNRSGFCWYDMRNGQIVFSMKPVNNSYEFDYIARPPALALPADEPIFNSDFHQMIVHGMAVSSSIINLFDKARSYAPENQAKYNAALNQLAQENWELQNN